MITGSAKRLHALIALGVALVCLAPASSQAAVQLNAGAISGMNGQALSELPALRWNRQLAAMSANGVQLVRGDADWGTIEPDRPGPHGPSWQFSYYDKWVRALALHHLTWQPILGYNNSWAQAVDDKAAFAAFGRAVAARYGANGSFWAAHHRLPYRPVTIIEVWNEENGPPWFTSPIDYAPLYAATRAAIHQIDPQVSVDVGGLADDSENFDPHRDYPATYVIQMLLTDPGLRGHIDGFALHPYATSANDVLDWVADFRRVLDGWSEGSAPIDITEFGWPTGDGAQESWRAAQMEVLGLAFRSAPYGIREVAPYDWIAPTFLHATGDFGFVDGSGRDTILRPAAVAWFRAFSRGGAVMPGGACPARRVHRHGVSKLLRRGLKCDFQVSLGSAWAPALVSAVQRLETAPK